MAVNREEWSGSESERPLTHEGNTKTQQAAEGLAQVSPDITHMLSSPFTRALETAQIIKNVFDLNGKIQANRELVYDHSPIQMFPILTKLPEDSCVVCVGHEPHLGQLAAMMISGKYLPGLSLKKAGACAIQFEGKPKIGCGSLEWWLKPAQLRRLRKP